METVTTVCLYALGAAACALLGALPLLGEHRLPPPWIGWGNALAAGIMLGVAYSLTTLTAPIAVPAGTLFLGGGAFLGIALTHGARIVLGGEPRTGSAPSYRPHRVADGLLHTGSEGVAIGAAMAVDTTFGFFLLGGIAVHNIPEAAVLVSALRQRGEGAARALGLTLASRSGQVVLAGVAFLLVERSAAWGPWVLGFAVGALLYLVLVELLPDSYRCGGATGIALVTSVALGLVALLREWLGASG